MSRKRIEIKTKNSYSYYVYDLDDGRIDKVSSGFLGWSFDGKVGTAKSLSDAIETCKALTGGSFQEVNIEDYD